MHLALAGTVEANVPVNATAPTAESKAAAMAKDFIGCSCWNVVPNYFLTIRSARPIV
jgi:hypothetical protein